MTPGTYIAKRREAAGLTREDVALAFDSVPAVSARARAEWLAQIEADIIPVPAGFIEAVSGVIAFDPAVLQALVDRHCASADIRPPLICKTCACSWEDPCIDASGRACAWANVAGTLCTACAPHPAAAATARQCAA